MTRKGEARLTLRPGDPGTKRHTEKFGERLVAVRYRYDEEALKRYTTVEIIVDERPWHRAPNIPDPDCLVGVSVAVHETAMQRAACGGRVVGRGGEGVVAAVAHRAAAGC